MSRLKLNAVVLTLVLLSAVVATVAIPLDRAAAAVDTAPVITEGDSIPLTVNEDTPGTLTLHATDPDPDDTLTWSIATQATGGVAIAGYGTDGAPIYYTPKKNYNGSDSFVVQVSDKTGGTDKITVNVTITPTPDLYYVDNTNPAASDSNAGTTPALPFLTMGKGASTARAGDTVQVLAGTYAETVKPSFTGAEGNPIVFFVAPGATAVVTGAPGNTATGGAFRLVSAKYIVVDGFNITGTADYGIYATGSDHLTIRNNHVSLSGNPSSGSARSGIQLGGTTYSTIAFNTTDHNTLHGISLSNGANNNTVNNNVAFGNADAVGSSATGILVSNSSDNTIIHNTAYGNQDTGLSFLANASRNRIVGNLTYGNGDHGIDNNNSPDNIIVGNTVHGNVTSGINLEGGTTGSGGATVRNNIVMDNGLRKQDGGVAVGKRGNIAVDGPSTIGTTLDYNEYYLTPSEGGTVQITWNVGGVYTSLDAFRAAVPGQETNGIEGAPLFTGPAPIAVRSSDTPYQVLVNQGDYHIGPGSKAIDSADADAPGEPTLDIAGKPRVDDPATPNTGAGVRLYDDRGAYEFQPAGIAGPVITEGASIDVTMSEDGSPTPFSLTLHAVPGNPDDTLTWSISTPASHGIASASGTGTAIAIGYTPDPNYAGSDSFNLQVADGHGGSDTITVNVTVKPVNDPPVLAPIDNKTIAVGSQLAFTATATDPDLPPDALTFSLAGAVPSGAAINATSGAFSWTPTEAQGPATYTFDVCVSDGTVTDCESITATVTKSNAQQKKLFLPFVVK